MSTLALLLSLTAAAAWQHPAGLITQETLAEIHQKAADHPWAREVLDTHRRAVRPWVDLSSEELRRIFPTRGGNVYHNFSCPTDRVSLAFDPFKPDAFTCGTCGKTYAPETDAGVYTAGDRYHGSLYDGWICLFHIVATQRMVEMATVGRVDGDEAMLNRAAELLLLYTERIQPMPWRPAPDLKPDLPTFRQYGSIFTYHREGDNKILLDLAQTYELIRDRLTPEQRAAVENHALSRMLEESMLEPIYVYDHNNVYQWHRTILQTALALERDDVVDWVFGEGEWSPEKRPEHRSMKRILATHFNPDGAFWELASGYHLYPVNHLCEFAVLSHNLSRMDPDRFPAERYDLTRRDSPGGQAIHNALTWFLSMAMPDRTMTIIGDSTRARSGMETYVYTAEVGYRYFDIREVGDYARFREGMRSWEGLLYGAPVIEQRETPWTSAHLSSGWVSLRSDWEGNRVWAGLNALIKGGGHQHADHLSLTHFAHGQLLSLEKSVPYNERNLRVLGTQTMAHNTVVVDGQSGPQGEDLTPEQTPVIRYFHAGPRIQFAEAHGDKLHPQAHVYRRSVALLEDVIVDLFRVEGGATHDWMVNHAGAAPELSPPVAPRAFAPEAWLANGSGRVLGATSDAAWTARWKVADVTSRLWMAGAPGTELFALETYPLNNAIITPEFPPTQTLCVRRTAAAPFLAVWDSWTTAPRLEGVEAAVNRPDAARLVLEGRPWYVAFGPGTAIFDDGLHLASDGAFAAFREDDGAVLVGGTSLHVTRDTVEGGMTLSGPATASLAWTAGESQITLSGDVTHDTRGGQDHPRPLPEVSARLEGAWSRGN